MSEANTKRNKAVFANRQNRGLSALGGLFLGLFLSSLLIFHFSQYSLIKNIRGFWERPVLSFQNVILGIKKRFSTPPVFFKTWQEAWLARISLEEKERRLLETAGELSVCLEENEAMRRLLGAPLPSSWHFIPAKVTAFYQKLKINVGEKAGVEKGMMVISENLLVGRVESVERLSSQVVLVTDPSLKIAVIIREEGQPGIKARGILSGYFQNQMTLSEVLKSENVEPGDLVFTSGEEDSVVGETGWLADLLIGEVKEIEESQEKVFKKGIVSPLIDFQNLRSVFVVKVF
jgi:rod shape-determining protein MreC